MNKHVSHLDSGQIFSERWEVDYLCNRFGLSRPTARNIVESFAGDRASMEREADRLAAYENFYRRHLKVATGRGD